MNFEHFPAKDNLAIPGDMSSVACLVLFVLVVHTLSMAMVLLCCRPAPEEIAAHDEKGSWIINFPVQHVKDDDELDDA